MDNRKSFSWKMGIAFFAIFALAACRVINASPGSVITPESGGYNLSISQIKEAAQAGDPDAQYALGYSYYYGKGLPQDMETATFWIRKAASQGQPQAVKALVLLGKSDSIYKDNRDVQHPNPEITDGKITPPPQSAAPIMGGKSSENAVPPCNKNERPDCNAIYPSEGDEYSGSPANAMIRKAQADANALQTSGGSPTPTKNSSVPTTSTSMPASIAPGATAPAPATSGPATVGTSASAAPVASSHGPVGSASVAMTASVPTSSDDPKPSPASTGLTLDDLMHSPGNYYTIQLLAASQENEINHYIQTHDLGGKTVSYRANRNGKDWYILTYGVYKTRQDAEEALEELPSTLRGLKPWVNTVAAVKVSMAKTAA
jgi:DamX protein